MKKILKDFKWSIFGLALGILSIYTAYFMPGEKLKGAKGYLFSFGSSIAFSYWLSLIQKVYNKLKHQTEE